MEKNPSLPFCCWKILATQGTWNATSAATPPAPAATAVWNPGPTSRRRCRGASASDPCPTPAAAAERNHARIKFQPTGTLLGVGCFCDSMCWCKGSPPKLHQGYAGRPPKNGPPTNMYIYIYIDLNIYFRPSGGFFRAYARFGEWLTWGGLSQLASG